MGQILVTDWLGPEPRTPSERFLCDAIDAAADLGVRLYLCGGYALDAYLGRQVRPHDDVDLIIRRDEWPGLEDILVAAGISFLYRAPSAPHAWMDGRHVADLLLAERHPDGFPFIRGPLGANPLPPGSLTRGPIVTMWDHTVWLVTLECLYVMKASGNFNSVQTGPKHETDLRLILDLLPAGAADDLAAYFAIRTPPHETRETA